MKRAFLITITFVIVIFVVVLIAAKEPAMSEKEAMVDAEVELKKVIEQGKALFNDTTLGTTGMSCNSCHPDGGTAGGEMMGMKVKDLHGAAATFPKYKNQAKAVITLEQMNNMCITMPMKGRALKLDSPEAIALAAYVTSLSNGMKIEMGKDIHSMEK
ncbi:c-type cytochrome [Candidatus Poribacteria bacterium]|nr:c-type cytochrome [Candidatus Poribacteria bacterium]